jgi:hypothetical protein
MQPGSMSQAGVYIVERTLESTARMRIIMVRKSKSERRPLLYSDKKDFEMERDLEALKKKVCRHTNEQRQELRHICNCDLGSDIVRLKRQVAGAILDIVSLNDQVAKLNKRLLDMKSAL